MDGQRDSPWTVFPWNLEVFLSALLWPCENREGRWWCLKRIYNVLSKKKYKTIKDGVALDPSSLWLPFNWQWEAKSRFSGAWWYLSKKSTWSICWVLLLVGIPLRNIQHSRSKKLGKKRHISYAPLLTKVCADCFYPTVSAETVSMLKPGCWQLQRHRTQSQLQNSSRMGTHSSHGNEWPCRE